ncbi:tetratricopeptide repeat protein [Saccharothrix sp. Mg75]|uniref:tetratricopeptide repeat protein n=1 Tax=Saccharothrix sp. Mg75 TaxID=3445357 RepID=UPI003EEF529D
MADRRHVPARIGVPDVVALEEETGRLRAVDYERGGGACRDAVVGAAARSGAMLRADATDAVRRRLLVALADLHNLAAWTCFDTGLDATALRHWRRAAELAARAGNQDLVANVHYRMGRLRLHRGAAAAALSCFEQGVAAARRAGSDHAVAMLFANQAWAFAALGDGERALRRLRRAHDAFAASTPEAAAAWARFFDETDLSALSGMVHSELARTVDPAHSAPAIRDLTAAVVGYPEEMTRSRTFGLIALTGNHLLDNDFDHAAAVGDRALALAVEVDSARVVDRLRPVGRLAESYRRDPDARELAGRIAEFPMEP